MLKKQIMLIFFMLLILNCYPKEYKYSKTDFVMGTTLEIIIFSKENKTAEKLIDQAFILARNLEKKSSCKLEESLISILNKKKELIIEDNFILDLLKKSYHFASITEGYFDPSLYNLLTLWGFENESNKVPSKKEIEKSLKECGYKNLIIENNKIILKNNVSIDLGGIAKGRIVDEISLFLINNNIHNFIVNAGGDLFVKGLYNSQRKWRVAIADPFDKNDVMGVIEISNKAVVTSGDYERFFIENGKVYHHILNPFTGYPAENEIHSVTVVANDAESADAMATAFFVMGKDKTLKIVNNSKDLWVILICGSKEKPEIIFSNNVYGFKGENNKWKFELR